ncbi:MULTISPECIES: DMT family transporter [Acinetobacter]|jgi:drug/metabolite transporter (DMT)-like permease|uniref:DMT family transporter n=2 Tax=Acinetobacter TaxID=469 RepID=A0A4Q7AR35_9GAMM|nr:MULTISPECIES: DMT family transporter [Acinetobacter]MCW8039683.1 DMT family transporter [Acinetobacter entericus]QXW27361.1 DMT family transporter [Acinetobacter johnsonii]RZG65697.1 DMT family transporter [Acinetobacter bouvetii]TCB76819.1 DMT family transporter [Acinetobacter sp. ANC 4177]
MKAFHQGWLYGLIGVMIFAGSMPATRIAVQGFSPEFLTGARACIAAVLALILLIALQQPRPSKSQIKSLCITSAGVVIGFPLFTALALQTATAAHSLIFIALLPLATAFFAVLRAKEAPKRAFWIYTCIGSSLVIFFMLNQSGLHYSAAGDSYMAAAVLLCGLGYAEGGVLSRELGGWQVICWALVIALPAMLLISWIYFPQNFSAVPPSAYLGLAYVSLFSMLIGFFFWYKGLALGGIAKVGQIQLIQPFIGLILCALILNEHVTLLMIAVSLAVAACVVMARKYA